MNYQVRLILKTPSRFRTLMFRPDQQVTLRNNADGWNQDLPGIYLDDEWQFELDEGRYPQGLSFKFVLERTYWMLGDNMMIVPAAGEDYI